jgi:hypothetical protein
VRGAFASINSKSPCPEYDCSDQINAYRQPLHSPGYGVRVGLRFRRRVLYDEWHSSKQSMGRCRCGLRRPGIGSRMNIRRQCHGLPMVPCSHSAGYNDQYNRLVPPHWAPRAVVPRILPPFIRATSRPADIAYDDGPYSGRLGFLLYIYTQVMSKFFAYFTNGFPITLALEYGVAGIASVIISHQKPYLSFQA